MRVVFGADVYRNSTDDLHLEESAGIQIHTLPRSVSHDIFSFYAGRSFVRCFSAFGQLRNSSTWSGAPISGSAELNGLSTTTRQGYTFQTWLGQSMGLNHMNGRVQDAIVGRFLSPDPRWQDPANAQSYNRYTYVGNNPLTFTDPAGFVPSCDNVRDGDDCLKEQVVVSSAPTANLNLGSLQMITNTSPGLTQQLLNRIGTYVAGTLVPGNFGYDVRQLPGTGSGNVLDTVLVTGSAILAPSAYQGFDFAGFSASPAFRSAGGVLNAAAWAVIGAANFMLGNAPAAAGRVLPAYTGALQLLAAEDATVFAGHGVESALAGTTIVPEGVALTLPVELPLSDRTRRGLKAADELTG